MPTAETAQYDEFGDPAGQPTHNAMQGQPITTPEQAGQVLVDFAARNPAAQDEGIQAGMLEAANLMRSEGYQPDAQDLPTMLAFAQNRQAEQTAQAKARNVQITGSGNSAPTGSETDDLDDIIDRATPRW